MMIILFLISSALLVEVGGRKYTGDLETANAILILTAAELDSSENSKLTGSIRFPKSTDSSGNKSDTPPTTSASKGHGRNSFHKYGGFTTHGFKPSYGNGIASLASMDFLYGNRILTGQHPMSKTRTHILASKSDNPQGKQNNKENKINNYLGYYDHHHYHYMANGKSHDRRPLSVSPNLDIQHEPENIGQDFHGNFNGHNHNHVHDQRNNNHNGYNNQGNHHNGGDGGGNGYFYHGHYGPEGVAHFHSGNQNGQGYRNGGNSYSYSSGDGYNYYYNNGDGNGNGYYYYHNGPQGDFHHHNDIQRPHHQDLPQNIHSGNNFGPEGQGNGFNSHGSFRPPENYDGNVDIHNHGENLNGQNQHFNGGPNHDRFPSSNVEHSQEHLDFRHPVHNNFRGPEGPFNNNGHNEFENGEPFRLPLDSHGSRFPEQDFRHNHNERFRLESNTPAGHKIEEIFHSPTYVPQNQAIITETFPEDNNVITDLRNIGSGHVHDAKLILNNRLQNPKIQDMYFNLNRESIHNREYQDGHRFHHPEFRPSEPFDVEGFRYGEPGNSFNTMHPRRRYYSPTFSSGDYGHRVYYGNFVGYTGNEDSLDNGYGYAKRFGYGNTDTREHLKEN